VRGLIFISVMVGLLAGSAYGMNIDVKVRGDSGVGSIREGHYWLDLEGKIEEGDSDELESIITLMGKFPDYVRIGGSEGGNLREAMRMGRLLRSGLSEIVQHAYCNSSCFFLWISGAERTAVGSIGIHRPKFDDAYFASLSEKDARAQYKKVQIEIQDYLEEMDVPADLVSEMMALPSNDLKVYTFGAIVLGKNESPMSDLVNKVGVVQPSYQEWLGSKCGRLSPLEIEIMASSNDLNVQKMLLEEASGGRKKIIKKVHDELSHELYKKIDAFGGPSEYAKLESRSRDIFRCEAEIKDDARQKEVDRLLGVLPEGSREIIREFHVIAASDQAEFRSLRDLIRMFQKVRGRFGIDVFEGFVAELREASADKSAEVGAAVEQPEIDFTLIEQEIEER